MRVIAQVSTQVPAFHILTLLHGMAPRHVTCASVNRFFRSDGITLVEGRPMIHKMLISAFATGLAMTIPLCLMFLQRGAGGGREDSWDKAFYHVLLLCGVAVIYWSVSLMHYMDLKKCNARTAVEK